MKKRHSWGKGFIIPNESLQEFDDGNTIWIDRWVHGLIKLLHKDIQRIENLDIPDPEIVIYGIIRNKGDDFKAVVKKSGSS